MLLLPSHIMSMTQSQMTHSHMTHSHIWCDATNSSNASNVPNSTVKLVENVPSQFFPLLETTLTSSSSSSFSSEESHLELSRGVAASHENSWPGALQMAQLMSAAACLPSAANPSNPLISLDNSSKTGLFQYPATVPQLNNNSSPESCRHPPSQCRFCGLFVHSDSSCRMSPNTDSSPVFLLIRRKRSRIQASSPRKSPFSAINLIHISSTESRQPKTEELVMEEDDVVHGACLRCSLCQATVDPVVQSRCFVTKDSQIHCCDCRDRLSRCGRCRTVISADSWVHRVQDQCYHISCFTCEVCNLQLSQGDHCFVQDGKLLCIVHRPQHPVERSSANHDDKENVQQQQQSVLSDSESVHGSEDRPSKRNRTQFTMEQIRVLQENFELDPNPDGHGLAAISVKAKLSKRVTQVWFQNARARQKRSMKQQKVNGVNFVGDSGSLASTATPSPSPWSPASSSATCTPIPAPFVLTTQSLNLERRERKSFF